MRGRISPLVVRVMGTETTREKSGLARDPARTRTGLVLDHGTAEAVIRSIDRHLTLSRAIVAAGGRPGDLARWRTAARKGSQATAELLLTLDRAEVEAEARLLDLIADAAKDVTPAEGQRKPDRGGWKAAAWLLERRHPKRWAPPRPDVEREVERRVSAERSVLLDLCRSVLSPEDFKRLAAGMNSDGFLKRAEGADAPPGR